MISLCPEGMPALISDNNRSSAASMDSKRTSVASQPQSRPPSKQEESNFLEKREMAKKAEAELEHSVSSRVDVSGKLEQDTMEGVDESEWVKKKCQIIMV